MTETMQQNDMLSRFLSHHKLGHIEKDLRSFELDITRLASFDRDDVQALSLSLDLDESTSTSLMDACNKLRGTQKIENNLNAPAKDTLSMFLRQHNLSNIETSLRDNQIDMRRLATFDTEEIQILALSLGLDESTTQRFATAQRKVRSFSREHSAPAPILPEPELDAARRSGAAGALSFPLPTVSRLDKIKMDTSLAQKLQEEYKVQAMDDDLAMAMAINEGRDPPPRRVTMDGGAASPVLERQSTMERIIAMYGADSAEAKQILSALSGEAEDDFKEDMLPSRKETIGDPWSAAVPRMTTEQELIAALGEEEARKILKGAPTTPVVTRQKTVDIEKDLAFAEELGQSEKVTDWHDLPTWKVTAQMVHQYGAQKKNCVVCQCEYEVGDTIRRMGRCGCLFHQECIDEWLDENEECPVDRYPVI